MPCRRVASTRLPDKVLAFLQNRGISFDQWCKDHGFNYIAARDVAVGRTLGFKGNALKIRLALKAEYDLLELGGAIKNGKKES